MYKTGVILVFCFSILLVLYNSGCTSIEKFLFEEELKGNVSGGSNTLYNIEDYKIEVIQNIIKTANYNLYNEDIFLDTEGSVGTLISFVGFISEQPYLKPQGLSYLVINGNSKMQIIDLIIRLSHPLPSRKTFNDSVRLVGNNSHIRAFGVVSGIEEVISFRGSKRVLPIVQIKILYDVDDRMYRHPLWICESLKK